MKNKFENKTKLLAMVLCAGMLATACDDNDDLISDLEDDVTILQGSVSDLLAAEADGLTVTSIDTTTDGYIVTFSDGSKVSIDNSAADDAITYVYDEETGKFTFYADGEEVVFGSSIVAITAVEILSDVDDIKFGKGRSTEIEIMVTPATAPVPSIDAFFVGVETEEDFRSGYDYEESAIFSVTGIEAISTGRYTLTISATADPSVYEFYAEGDTDEEDALYYEGAKGDYRLYVSTIDVANSDSQVYASSVLSMKVKEQDWSNCLDRQDPILLFASTIGDSESFFINFGKVTTYDPDATKITVTPAAVENRGSQFIYSATTTAGEFAAAGVDGSMVFKSDIDFEGVEGTYAELENTLGISIKVEDSEYYSDASVSGIIPVTLVNTDVMLGGGESIDVTYLAPGSASITEPLIADVADFRLPYGSYEVEEGFAPEVTVEVVANDTKVYTDPAYATATSAFTAEFVDVAVGGTGTDKNDYASTALKLTAVAGYDHKEEVDLLLSYTLDINVGTESEPEMVPFTFYNMVFAEPIVPLTWKIEDVFVDGLTSARNYDYTIYTPEATLAIADYINFEDIAVYVSQSAETVASSVNIPVEDGYEFAVYYMLEDEDGESVKTYFDAENPLVAADFANYDDEDDAFLGYSDVELYIEVVYGDNDPVDVKFGPNSSGTIVNLENGKYTVKFIKDFVEEDETSDNIQAIADLVCLTNGSSTTLDLSSKYVFEMNSTLTGTAYQLSYVEGNVVTDAVISLANANDAYAEHISIDGYVISNISAAQGFDKTIAIDFILSGTDLWGEEYEVGFKVIFSNNTLTAAALASFVGEGTYSQNN